jgi:hypothetical protein
MDFAHRGKANRDFVFKALSPHLLLVSLSASQF